jgi:small subunit ribosomal protein S18
MSEQHDRRDGRGGRDFRDRGGDRDFRDRGDRGGDNDRDGGAGKGRFRPRRGGFTRRKVDRFLVDGDLAIDYKDPQLLKNFVTERGKIIPRRISGNNAGHQRQVAVAVKRARMIALMPFAVTSK